MEKQFQYKGIDIFKFIMALFIVVLHTHPLYGINDALSFLMADVVGRVAVPFFFVATGFLLEQKIQSSEVGHKEVVGQYVKKIFALYLLWSVIYLPVIVWDKIVDGQVTLTRGIFTIIRDFVFVGSYAQLWYLPATMVGVILVTILTKHMKVAHVAAILFFLFCIGLLTQSYFGLLVRVVHPEGVLWNIMKMIKKIMVTCRNGLFSGAIFVYMGKWIAVHDMKIGYWKAGSGLLASIILLAVEATVLEKEGYVRERDMYLMLLPSAFFMLMFARQVSVKITTFFFRKMSMNIFYVHMIFKFLYRKLVDDTSGTNMRLFLFTMLGAFVTSYVMYWIESKKMMQSGDNVLE